MAFHLIYEKRFKSFTLLRRSAIPSRNNLAIIDFRKLFESTPGLYLILRSDFTIVGVTDAYLQATKTVREQIVGKGLFEVFPDNPADPHATGADNLRASLQRVLKTRKTDAMAVQKYDIRKPESEGGGFEERFWSPVNSPIIGSNAEVDYIVHRVEDVTEFVRMKQFGTQQTQLTEELKSRAGQMEADILRRAHELQEANRQLRLAEENNKKINADLERRVAERVEQLKQTEEQVRQLQKMDAIGALAGGLAHDFNNLLGAISMYCDLLEELSSDPKKVQENTEEIRLVTNRGAALTRQLLIFSRKQVVQQQKVDLNGVIQALLKMLNRLIGENIQIVKKLSSDLNSIQADPAQIEQVIMNLIVNARDAMPNGGVITLETSNVTLTNDFTSTHLAVNPGPHVQLSVTDTGCGMTPEVQARLFEPFFSTKPIGKGTGLGLPTAYGIIKQCKGTIWVYSEVGKGSVFRIYFPVSKDTDPAKVVESLKHTPARGSETILLVEDDEKLRLLYSEALKRFGYKTLLAQDGEEALQIIHTHEDLIDLLLTDVMMPKMGGIELAQQAKKKNAKLHVLCMSGYINDPAESEFSFADLKFAFIQKPFDTSALVTKIREVLSVSK